MTAAVSTAGEHQAGDEVSPQLGGLPGEEEEAEEAHNDRLHRLIRDLGVHLSQLRQIRGLTRPHRGGAETEQNTGRDQRVESREELGSCIKCGWKCRCEN